MLLNIWLYFTLLCLSNAVQDPTNPTSEISTDEKPTFTRERNKTLDQSDQDDSENEADREKSSEDGKDKKYLIDAMKTVLDPSSIIEQEPVIDTTFKENLENIDKKNLNITLFMNEMDQLSLEICKKSQESLWSYVMDISDENKKNEMIKVAGQEDEIKKQYWNLLKKKFLNDEIASTDPKLRRKIRIIKERGTNVQMPQSKQREEIDSMQRIWSRVSVCAFETPTCTGEDSVKSMSDVISIFRTSNSSKELTYYWKAFRDATGKKIRPIYKDYVARMNRVAESENFTDAGEMWRFAFEDDHFVETVDRLWKDIKVLYDLIHDYVRDKLKEYYTNDMGSKDETIPSHLLGNLWGQEWQPLYSKVTPYPDYKRPLLKNHSAESKQLFSAVDDFHKSLGFESASDSFKDIHEFVTTPNCLPSSHDMCDGKTYKIKWCGETSNDLAVGIARAARLLGHIQYFMHYKHQPALFRDGPSPAFHDAISDITAVQLTSPEHLNRLGIVTVETGQKVTINNLMWLALEKFPLMGYAYVLDRWRWDIFANKSGDNWNQHWWDLRIKETGISAPVPRNESDLDPAAKYHVVSHVQYVTYLISHILEFQMLLALCKAANHTGPLHECSLYGKKEAGRLLSTGMSYGASEHWTTVLKIITNETELSTEGILEYFKPLRDFLINEKTKKASLVDEDMDKSAPIIVGIILVILTFLIVLMYCVKKYDLIFKIRNVFGISKNGSLDITSNELAQGKANEAVTNDEVSEDKV